MSTQSNIFPWDDRDNTLNLRFSMAKLVAEKISGVYDAQPNECDYEIADKLGSQIMTLFEKYLNHNDYMEAH